MHKDQNTIMYWLFIGFVVAVSFYYLSPLTSYVFHSDIAIHVLMTHGFRWPEDVYYWGQDRLGSIVPAFGNLIYRCFHFSPIICAALSEYFFLMIGFFSLSSLFRTAFSRIIFAVAWFLPLLAFQELVQLSQPYGEQACFLGLMVFFTNKWLEQPEDNRWSILFYVGAIVSVFVSVWIADISLVAYLLLIPVLARHVWKAAKGKIVLYAGLFVLVSAMGFWFISFAKQVHPKEDDYSSRLFLSGAEAFSILGTKMNELYHTLIFETGNVLYSWPAVFFVLGVLLLFYFLVSQKEKSASNMMWRNYFLVYTVFCGLLLFSSYWVLKNFSGNRYFTVLYVSIWIVVLLSSESLTERRRKILSGVFLVVALLSAASSVVPHYTQGRSANAFSRLEGFRGLGRIGIIGNYWRSYYIAAADPENIVATTCETEKPRCRECIDSVMARPTIYLVQENWLDSLPTVIWQYGKELIRTDKPTSIGGLMVAPYVIRPEMDGSR